MGKKWAKSVFCGEKMGKFFEGGIFVIRQRVDHRDLLFEPPDKILYHEEAFFSRMKTRGKKEKTYPMRRNASDRDKRFEMEIKLT